MHVLSLLMFISVAIDDFVNIQSGCNQALVFGFRKALKEHRNQFIITVAIISEIEVPLVDLFVHCFPQPWIVGNHVVEMICNELQFLIAFPKIWNKELIDILHRIQNRLIFRWLQSFLIDKAADVDGDLLLIFELLSDYSFLVLSCGVLALEFVDRIFS